MMAKKFTNTIKDEVANAARDIKDNTVMTYEMKRAEIEEKYIPKSALAVLTPEEIKRAQRVGLVVGFVVLIAVIIAVVICFS